MNTLSKYRPGKCLAKLVLITLASASVSSFFIADTAYGGDNRRGNRGSSSGGGSSGGGGFRGNGGSGGGNNNRNSGNQNSGGGWQVSGSSGTSSRYQSNGWGGGNTQTSNLWSAANTAPVTTVPQVITLPPTSMPTSMSSSVVPPSYADTPRPHSSGFVKKLSIVAGNSYSGTLRTYNPGVVGKQPLTTTSNSSYVDTSHKQSSGFVKKLPATSGSQTISGSASDHSTGVTGGVKRIHTSSGSGIPASAGTITSHTASETLSGTTKTLVKAGRVFHNGSSLTSNNITSNKSDKISSKPGRVFRNSGSLLANTTSTKDSNSAATKTGTISDGHLRVFPGTNKRKSGTAADTTRNQLASADIRNKLAKLSTRKPASSQGSNPQKLPATKARDAIMPQTATDMAQIQQLQQSSNSPLAAAANKLAAGQMLTQADRTALQTYLGISGPGGPNAAMSAAIQNALNRDLQMKQTAQQLANGLTGGSKVPTLFGGSAADILSAVSQIIDAMTGAAMGLPPEVNGNAGLYIPDDDSDENSDDTVGGANGVVLGVQGQASQRNVSRDLRQLRYEISVAR